MIKVEELFDALCDLGAFGVKSPKTARQIARFLGKDDAGTQVHLRQAAAAANARGLAILSSSKGFFIADDKQEIVDYAIDLMGRAKAISQRASNVLSCNLGG